MGRKRGPRKRTIITKRVGDRIKSLRLERGYTTSELAVMCGTSNAAIRTLEAGERAASVVVLETVARQLRVPVSDLFLEPAPTPRANERVFLRLVRDLRERSTDELEAVEKLVAALDRVTHRA